MKVVQINVRKLQGWVSTFPPFCQRSCTFSIHLVILLILSLKFVLISMILKTMKIRKQGASLIDWGEL